MFEQLLAAGFDRALRDRDDVDDRVADAMRAVPRHAFVPPAARGRAYADEPISIGHGQTTSQPSLVAKIATAARVQPTDRVLEVGAGSGFAAAILGHLAADVVAVERIPQLVAFARENLARANIDRVRVVEGDAWFSPDVEGVFDVVVISAGAPRVPPSAIERLAAGGRLIVPVGTRRENGSVHGRLLRVERRGGEVVQDDLGACAWVPLVGVAGFNEG